MALLLKEADVARLLTMDDAIAAAREVVKAQSEGTLAEQPRRRVAGKRAVLSAMFATHAARGLLGGKVYVASKSAGVRFLVALFDQDGARLLALIEADHLGLLRTGAMSAVAADLLARKDAQTVGMIGAGYQAQAQLSALALVRGLKRATVYARRRDRLEAFCRRMEEELGFPVVPATRREECVAGQDVVVTITGAKETVLFGRELEAGQHVNVAGSNRAHDREVDDDAVLRSAVVAVDSQETAALEAGDVIPLIARGELKATDLPTLGDIAAGRHHGRREPGDVTMFLSQGIAALDVAAGAIAMDKAREAGIGQEVDLLS